MFQRVQKEQRLKLRALQGLMLLVWSVGALWPVQALPLESLPVRCAPEGMLSQAPKTAPYSWDFDGNPDQMQYPSNAVIDFTFDAQNRNTALTAHNGVIANNAFDAGSRLTSRTLNTGIVCSYAWDKLNRPLQSSDQALKLQWNFDNEANRLFERKAFGSTSTADHYLYDNLYRVIGTKYGVASTITPGVISETNLPTAPAYDVAVGTKTEQSQLDKEHNRITQTVNGVGTAYVHDNRDRYTSVGGSSLTWDDNGNLLNDGTQKYVWDAENRLLEVRTQANALLVSYLYDAQGRRIAKVFPNGNKVFSYWDHEWNLLAEYNQAGVLLREYTPTEEMDHPLTATLNLQALGINPVTYGYAPGTNTLDVIFHANPIGNVMALSDTSGAVIERYSYNINGAFEVQNASGAVVNRAPLSPALFTGREFDSESGLYFYRHRMYSPTLGRFISTDPEWFEDSTNLYQYALCNPVTFTDPMGLSIKDDVKDAVKGAYLMDKERRQAESQKSIGERITDAVPGVKQGKDLLSKYTANRDAGMNTAGAALDAGIQKANELTGGQALLEGGLGLNRSSGEEIQGLDRGMKVLEGLSQLALTALGGAQAGEGLAGTKATATDSKIYFGQPGVSPQFSKDGFFKNADIDNVAEKLKSGELNPRHIEVKYIKVNGTNFVVNNRSLTALSKAGLKPINTVNMTGKLPKTGVDNEASVMQRLKEINFEKREYMPVRKTKDRNSEIRETVWLPKDE